jgi:ubiquitin-protein ligase E3 C
MAHHLLHQQVRTQADAFVRGFRSLIAPAWLRVFAPAELRLLIAGAGGRIDVDDLMNHTAYSGGYDSNHPTIAALWQAVREFTEEEQRDLLRFVTACPNTPLLGFGQLAPPFCVHRSGMVGGSSSSEADADTARLPTGGDVHEPVEAASVRVEGAGAKEAALRDQVRVGVRPVVRRVGCRHSRSG